MRPHRGADGRLRARVRIDGEAYYCGAWGSPEAEEKYRGIVAKWLANNDTRESRDPMVSELVIAFLSHATAVYRKPNGAKGSELCIFTTLAKYLIDLHGQLPIRNFGPRELKDLREKFLEHRWSRRKYADRDTDPNAKPWSRRQVNDHVRRVIRIFRWGLEHDLTPPGVMERLEAVRPPVRGKTSAPEHDEPEPVDWRIVKATLPHLAPVAAALVQVLWLTGARSGEVCSLRPIDLDRSERLYTSWHASLALSSRSVDGRWIKNLPRIASA